MLIIAIIFSLTFGFVLGCGILKSNNFKKIPKIFTVLPIAISLIYVATLYSAGVHPVDFAFPINMPGTIKAAYCFIFILWSNFFAVHGMKKFPNAVMTVASVAFGKHLER